LKTKYVEDQYLNTVKSHESNLPNMNSTITAAANVATKLNQSNEKRHTNNESTEHINAKLGDSLKNGKEK
jgi:hypothetical protein